MRTIHLCMVKLKRSKRLISGCTQNITGTPLLEFRYANILLMFITTFFLNGLAPGSQFCQLII